MASALQIRDIEDGCMLPVRVHPGAKRNGIAGLHDGALKVSLAAPAVDGRANEALIRFMAERVGVRRVQVSLASGATSRSKTLHISGKSAAQVLAVMAAFLR